MSQVDQVDLYLSSVPLVRIGADSLPTGRASGCLIDYGGKRFLLTVAHATGDNQRWALEVRFDEAQKQIQLFGLGAMNFLASGTVGTAELKPVDFSYVQVPPTTSAFRQEIEAPSNVIKAERPIKVHTTTLEELPDAADRYGFCGIVLPAQEEHFGMTYASGEFRIYENLTFLRREGDKLVFKLPSTHPGHDQIKGCSGAPILNGAGVPVALVTGGCEKTDEVFGLSLAAYKVAIDIEVGVI